MTRQFGVLGGGIAGLTTAYYLSLNPQNTVYLIESSCKFGGWISTIHSHNHIFELGPRTLRPQGPQGKSTLELIRELGIENELIYIPKSHSSAKNKYIYYNEKIQVLPSSMMGLLGSLRTPVLSGFWKGLLREPFVPKRSRDMRDESIHDFISRRFNKDTSLDLVSAIVHGIYAGDVSKLSVKSTLKLLWELEGEYGSVIKGLLYKSLVKQSEEKDPWIRDIQSSTSVYSFKNGLGSLVSRLVDVLSTRSNVQLLKKECITQLSVKDSAKQISIKTRSHSLDLDHVFSCLPAYSLASLVPEPMATVLQSIPFVDVAVVNILFPPKASLPIQGFGYLIPKSQKSDILGVIFDSETLAQQSISKQVKLTVMMGNDKCHLTHEELKEIALKRISQHLGISAPPEQIHVCIHRKCIPQYVVGHEENVNKIYEFINQSNLPLTLLGSSFTGVGINDVINAAKMSVLKLK